MAIASSAHAQSGRVGGTFYGKFGGGISDYTGDFPIQSFGHPVDFQEFPRGSGIPLMVVGEVGYRLTSQWALALGFQGGNYPIVGYSGQGDGISDSYRYTPQLLGRYTFGSPDQTVAPYLDGGLNATFGGATGTGVGPSVGGGIDILVNRSLSFYVESRFNLTLADEAIDGASYSANGAPAGASGSVTGPFDSVNQLLGFGLKVNLTTPTAPRVIALDGPAEVKADTSVTFAATINEGEVTRPLHYHWKFGDGETGSGLTATHAFNQPGTYTVSFSATNEAGEARESITVEATRSSSQSTLSKEARIATLTASPNPVASGEPVQFRSAVEGSSAPRYKWSFGDGSTATGSSSTHTYENPGRYTARLRVANEAGEDTRTLAVRVNPYTNQDQGTEENEQGQWGVVVSSMRNNDGAETVARRYRDRFAESMPVEVVAANTDQGLRYRVIVGEFENADAARQAIEEHKADLPSEAWPLPLR